MTLALATPSVVEASAVGDVAVHGLLDRLVRATGNHALLETFRRVDARLAVIGEAERHLFGDIEDEARAVIRMEATGWFVEQARTADGEV